MKNEGKLHNQNRKVENALGFCIFYESLHNERALAVEDADKKQIKSSALRAQLR
jgi:hypothetical protein